LLKLSGCGEQLFPGFQGTSSWYLHPLLVEALSPPSELDRIVSRLEAARAVVVVRGNYPPFTDVPRIRHALEGCTRVMEGKHFEVYLRDSPRP